MGIRTWFWDLVQGFTRTDQVTITDEMCVVASEAYYKQLAIETAINLISNTLALSEFRTYKEGLDVKEKNYYLFNVQPSQNYNASRFWRKLIYKLVYDNEALVVQVDKQFFVADDFKRKENALVPCVYTDVVIDGYNLSDTFEEKQVFYFAMHSTRMSSVINGLYKDYGKLIEYSKNNYKRANARRGVLEIPANYPQTSDASEKLSNLLNKNFKTFFEAENGAVLPLANGLKFTDLTNQTYKNSSDSRDIRSLVDDMFDYVAIAFQIPPQFLKGTIAESDNNWSNFMTLCIEPLAELLEKEINRKYYSEGDYLDRTYLKIDTTLVRAISLKELAESIDLLNRNGVNTLDDNLKMMKREPIGGELGSTRFMTLNLSTIENTLRGGAEDKTEEN